MTRLQFIVAALHLAAPHWRPIQATALEIERLERQYQVDAVLIVALGHLESRWHEQAINSSSNTIGLLQIQPANFPACRGGDALGCAAVRVRLFDWRQNLRIGVSYYAASRQYCLRRGRGAEPATWLWGPLGFDAVNHSRCGWRDGRPLSAPHVIVDVLQKAASLRHALKRRVLEGPRARPKR